LSGFFPKNRATEKDFYRGNLIGRGLKKKKEPRKVEPERGIRQNKGTLLTWSLLWI
jgi:hypothetical protein